MAFPLERAASTRTNSVRPTLLRVSVSVLALVLGVLSAVSAGRVLLGFSTPEPPVLVWLVVYNGIAGLASIAAAFAIYARGRWQLQSAAAIFAGHTAVLLVLVGLTLLDLPVAGRSIAAMSLRVVVWGLIVGFLIRSREERG